MTGGGTTATRARPRRGEQAVHWLLAVAALVYLGFQVPSLLHSARAAASQVDTVRWGWVAAAAVAGLVAVATYAELTRRLLTVGGASVPSRAVQSITFAENAITNTVPVVGGAGGVAYGIERLHVRGADPALASWAVLLAGALDFACLLLLAAVGLAATGRMPVAAAFALVGLVVAVSLAVWALATHPGAMRRVLRPLVGLVGWVRTRMQATDGGPAEAGEVTARVADRLALLRPSTRQWALVIGMCLATWLLDFGDLVAAAAAVDRPLPWSGLVAGYLVVQASIALQVLPGGAGLSEVGLLGTLSASGVAAGAAAATVVIYRTCSWLLPSVVGWGAYGVNAHTGRR